jgi:hypothetical protein
MSSKSDIKGFKESWVTQSTSDKLIVIVSNDEPQFIKINAQRVTELDLRLDYIKDVGGQSKQGKLGGTV